MVLRPEVDDESTGGEKELPMEDGSLLSQGYAPTKHTLVLTVKTDVTPITAFRLELLNDPNLPLGGPGRSIKGTAALTEFRVEAAPADAPGKTSGVKFSKATADVNPPEKPLDPIFDDKSGKKRVTGPIGFAIDGKDETAWGIDVGPGRRNQPRKAVFTAEKPIAFPRGTILTFRLTQNHGGWNSDDNQNHNLGRFRISITTKPDAVADPLPRAVREVLAIPRDRRIAGPGRGRLQLLAHHRPRLEGRQRPHRRPLGQAPRGRGATRALRTVAATADPRPPARRLPQAGPARSSPASPPS